MFSPYSSPNTNTWITNPPNQNSGIFIRYYNYTGSTPPDLAYIKIYKSGTGNGELPQDTILQLTPPSRPMGLIVLPCDSQPSINNLKRIKLRWNQNMEPDMERTINGEQGLFKRYKIYRSTAANLESVPPDALQHPENYYDEISTININKDSNAVFVDSVLVSSCNDQVCGATSCWNLYPVRYRVQAVDKYEDESVSSDFAKTEAWDTQEGEGGEYGGDNIASQSPNKNIPDRYDLKQNFPNPFNPTTSIQYDLPEDNFVTIKIYDILGKEVYTLVNEFKQAGRYSVSFNGSNFSSGMYFFRINAGNFEKVNKMILLK